MQKGRRREKNTNADYFIEGTSFESERKAKEQLAKSLALQKELEAQPEQATAEVMGAMGLVNVYEKSLNESLILNYILMGTSFKEKKNENVMNKTLNSEELVNLGKLWLISGIPECHAPG